MNLSKRITHINVDSNHHQYNITSNDHQLDTAEVVIVTVPVPQVLTQFKGSIAQFIGRNKSERFDLDDR
jgi:predicted NAD/FAD-dependent oxidoreductase